MARPYFTPRREECSLCNAIMMMVWNLKVDVRCNSCNRQYYAPTNNPQQRTDPSGLNNIVDGSILNQLDEFQMNCTNAWCSFRILIKSRDPQREEKIEKFRLHKTQCQKMYDEGKRFKEIDEKNEEVYVDIQNFGLTNEAHALMLEQRLEENDKHDQETDTEVTDSSQNRDDSGRGFSDSDDDMTTN